MGGVGWGGVLFKTKKQDLYSLRWGRLAPMRGKLAPLSLEKHTMGL